MAYYDFDSIKRDLDLFTRARREPFFFSVGDVEDGWGDTEAVTEALIGLVLQRVQAAAETAGTYITPAAADDFAEAIRGALGELYYPVQDALDGAHRGDPNAEHRLDAIHYGIGCAA